MKNSIPGLNFRFHRQVPVILQAEAAECGLACLAMVSEFYGHTVDLRALRQRFTTSSRGMTGIRLMAVASSIGLSPRALRIELSSLNQLRLPAVAHWDFNHFVVIIRVRRGYVLLNDPAIGQRKLPLQVVSRHFTGVAFELIPSLDFQPANDRPRVDIRALMGRVVGLRATLVQMLALASALEIFSILAPFLTQWLIDDALVSGDRDLISVIAIVALFFGLLQTAIGQVRSLAVLHISTTLGVQWSANVLRHLLRLPLAFFENRHIGDILSRFGATGQIQQSLTTTFVTSILDGMLALTTLAMLIAYSRPLAGIALMSVIVYAALRALRYRTIRQASEAQIVRQAKLQTNLMETIRGVQAIKLFGKEEDRQAGYLQRAVEVANSQIEVQRLGLSFQAANGILGTLEGAAILWLGGQSVLAGTLTVGMFVAFLSYKAQFSTRVMSLVDRASELAMLRLQAERLADIVLTKVEGNSAGSLIARANIDATIELKGVSFRFAESEPWILDNVNLKISAGESVAIVGPSGAGKTTLIKVILGLLEPQQGEVWVGGIPREHFGTHAYRAMFAAVMQNDVIFAGSVADNISFFDSHPDQENIERCARIAGLSETINRLPMGYNSLIGDMTNTLSGGQLQRVFLARALYRKPKVLVLDEATSHLDIAAERSIVRSLAKLTTTRICIAHRPETIRQADRVLRLMSNGRIGQCSFSEFSGELYEPDCHFAGPLLP